MAVTPSPGAKGLRRSLHFVPGGNARMFEKALSLNADSLILDLEDSVTPENKADARQAVCDWISQADFGAQECLVRINPQDSPWGREDLEAVVCFLDVSGFTALSEKLQKEHGQAGD